MAVAGEGRVAGMLMEPGRATTVAKPAKAEKVTAVPVGEPTEMAKLLPDA